MTDGIFPIISNLDDSFDIVRAFRGVERYEVVDGERVTVFRAKQQPIDDS